MIDWNTLNIFKIRKLILILKKELIGHFLKMLGGHRTIQETDKWWERM